MAASLQGISFELPEREIRTARNLLQGISFEFALDYNMKMWDGAEWVTAGVANRSGASWQRKAMKIWTGVQWVQVE